jgi:predicted dehydrogenase
MNVPIDHAFVGSPLNRRLFLASALVGTAFFVKGAPSTKKYRAAVIGRTGAGDYGHGFDTIFPDSIVFRWKLLADPDESGRKAAGARAGSSRLYADYREMLDKEKPQLVSIAPRQPDCHRDMALACIDAGAHIVIEKPITENLDEADEIVAAARRRGLKIAVGHKNRYSTDFARMQRLIREGFFGTVLEMRVQGKQDARCGRRGPDRSRHSRF